MTQDAGTSATRRMGTWCTRGRLAAFAGLAGAVTIAVVAFSPAGGASGAHGAQGEPPRAAIAGEDAPVLGSFGLAPHLTDAESATLASIERYAEIASRPTATAVPASPTPVAPTSTPAPRPVLPRGSVGQAAPTPRAAVATPVPPTVPAPTSTPVSPPPPAQTSGLDASPMDGPSQVLFDDTNRRRASQGLPPLRPNGDLVGIARIRSRDMADHNYFAHVSPITGDNAFTLMDKHGVPYSWAGENLAKNNYPDGEAVGVADVALWNSPPHKENILNPHYTDMGIALVVDASGMKYFTIIFTGPP